MDKFRAGDILEGVVSDTGAQGEGIVKIGAYPFFIPFAAYGEEIRFRVSQANKNYAFGDIIDILKRSDDRVKPLCPYFGNCGGCDLQHLNYNAQLEVKRLSVARTLKKNGGFNIDVPAVLHDSEWEYRNKLSMPFGFNAKSGRRYLGFYEKKSHKVVPVKWCPLHGQWAAELIKIINEWANENAVGIYNEKTHTGLLRHLSARMLDTLSAVFVINGDMLPYKEKLIEALKQKFKDFSLYASKNTENTNVILGDEAKLIYGTPCKQNLGAFSAGISPMSFLQVNNAVRDMLYNDVRNQLNNFAGDIVELYSGTGLLTAQLAARLKNSNFISVEIVPQAVSNAKKLMSELGFSSRVNCLCDDGARFMKHDNKIGAAALKPRALILDPPRKGCDADVLEAAKSACFEKIVYISCNPATLARDLKILCSPSCSAATENGYSKSVLNVPDTDVMSVNSSASGSALNATIDGATAPMESPAALNGNTASNENIISNRIINSHFAMSKASACDYRISYVQPYDMFPQTSHVETLVLMSRIDK